MPQVLGADVIHLAPNAKEFISVLVRFQRFVDIAISLFDTCLSVMKEFLELVNVGLSCFFFGRAWWTRADFRSVQDMLELIQSRKSGHRNAIAHSKG